MFTGDATGRRVNLGGSSSSRNLDRSALLEKQRIERMDRERLRMQIESCTKIQARYRGWRVRKNLRREYQSVCEQSLRENNYGKTIVYLTGLWLLGNAALVFVISDRGFVDFVLLNSKEINTIRMGALMSSLRDENLAKYLSSIPTTRMTNILALARINITVLFQHVNNVYIVDKLVEDIATNSTLFARAISARFETYNDELTDSLLSKLPLVTVGNISENAISNMSTCLVHSVRHSRKFWEHLAVLMVDCTHRFGRNNPTQSSVINELFLNNFAIPENEYLVQLVDFEKLNEETIFQIATHSNTCQIIANLLLKKFNTESSSIWNPSDSVSHLVISFTSIYLAVVRGVHASSSGIVNQTTIENLFPKLNLFAYRRIVDGVGDRFENLFTLIRSIYDKKFLFKNLKSESVWVITESVHQIPPNLNSFDIIDKLRREEEEEEEEEEMVDTELMNRKNLFTSAIFETIVEKMPHVIPFTDRVRILASALAEDKRNHFLSSRGLGFPQRSRGSLKRVRREQLLDDGMKIFNESSDSLKDILQIEFVSRDNFIEAGIDGGGLFKEFLHSWTRSVMDPQFGLFQQLPNGRLSPNPEAYKVHADGKYFCALGRAVAKALYDMVLLDTHLGEAFLDRVIGRSYSLEQLAEIDESLYKNLKFVGTDCDNIDELALTFAITGRDHETVELIPNGSGIAVNDSNKIKYVLLASWVYLARQLEKPAAAFASGFNEVVPISWLRMFSPREINLLISGEQREGFDIDDLKANVVYGGGYHGDSETVKMFWEVVREMSPKDQSTFLEFVTSSPRPPLLGFRVLHPKFAINRVPEPDRLPTASTCNNLFKLPDYRNKQLLRDKLISALYSHGGFDLS